MTRRATTRLWARGVALPGRLAATDLDLDAGSLTALVGPNGAGKTSLLHALAGIGRPHGEVRVDGRALAAVSANARPSVLGYVPAARELLWPLSVRAFVTLTAPSAAPAEVEAMLDSFLLADLADRRVDRLSTGERSRVMLARALLPRPAVLLLDEPFANLDPLWQLRLAARLTSEAATGTAILVSVHDLSLAARLAPRLLVIDEGVMVADGAPAVLMDNGTIASVFGVVREEDGTWARAIAGERSR